MEDGGFTLVTSKSKRRGGRKKAKPKSKAAGFTYCGAGVGMEVTDEERERKFRRELKQCRTAVAGSRFFQVALGNRSGRA